MKKATWAIIGIILILVIVIGFSYYVNNKTISYKNREYRASVNNSLSFDDATAKYGEIVDSGVLYKGKKIYITRSASDASDKTSTVIFLKVSDFYKEYGLVGGP